LLARAKNADIIEVGRRDHFVAICVKSHQIVFAPFRSLDSAGLILKGHLISTCQNHAIDLSHLEAGITVADERTMIATYLQRITAMEQSTTQ
jgi:hypothetical protein